MIAKPFERKTGFSGTGGIEEKAMSMISSCHAIRVEIERGSVNKKLVFVGSGMVAKVIKVSAGTLNAGRMTLSSRRMESR